MSAEPPTIDSRQVELSRTQALFLHERLIENAVEEPTRSRLAADARRRKEGSFEGSETAHVGAYESVAAHLCLEADELDVAVVADQLSSGQLVVLTQDFYIRRESEEEGRFKANLDVNREIEVHGRFSASRLIGSTGQTETFGHKRFSMLAYVGDFSLSGPSRRIELRPLFIGWRLLADDTFGLVAPDRCEVWAEQIDQFADIRGQRASGADRKAVQVMPESDVKAAFADIIGEPFVMPDWGGETSDLSTNRLSIDGDLLSAAFAFKGPALSGTLQISGMGKNGDQGVRLTHESVDLYVVQHHDAVAANVINFMSALARGNQRRFMVIDGETTARILRVYGKLPET